MKKLIILGTLIFIFSVSCFAQAKPDYSGRWALDLDRLKIYEAMSFPAITKTVKQTETEIEILNDEDTAKFIKVNFKPFICRLDWNEVSREVETAMGKVVVSQKAGFNKENHLEIVRKQITTDPKSEISMTETWELADEGKTLKIRNILTRADGESISELVFTRAAENSQKKKKNSGEVINGKALRLIQPSYPAEAKKARAEGTVYVQILIDEKGDVVLAKSIAGHPALLAVSEKAARLSKFSQTKIKGSPVRVSGIIAYNFIQQ